MARLDTQYLGLDLKNPLVPSASPLSKNIDSAKQLEDAGASALVMYSLFEEEIHHEEESMMRFIHQQSIGHAEADSFQPVPADYISHLDKYLQQLSALKSSLDIPVIASLNGVSQDGWVRHGKELAQAGADALELNVYYIAAQSTEPGSAVEARYIELLQELRKQVDIPITMKLSSQFSSIAHFVKGLEQAGANGVSLFNRFYQPDIDLETLKVKPHLELSTSAEALLRIRWVALLHGQVNLSLAVTGGMHNVEDVLKALLAGADITHLCSELLANGPVRITDILKQLSEWMDEHEYESVSQLKGSISQKHAEDPAAYERANYLDVIDSYSSSTGVRR